MLDFETTRTIPFKPFHFICTLYLTLSLCVNSGSLAWFAVDASDGIQLRSPSSRLFDPVVLRVLRLYRLLPLLRWPAVKVRVNSADEGVLFLLYGVLFNSNFAS